MTISFKRAFFQKLSFGNIVSPAREGNVVFFRLVYHPRNRDSYSQTAISITGTIPSLSSTTQRLFRFLEYIPVPVNHGADAEPDQGPQRQHPHGVEPGHHADDL